MGAQPCCGVKRVPSDAKLPEQPEDCCDTKCEDPKLVEPEAEPLPPDDVSGLRGLKVELPAAALEKTKSKHSDPSPRRFDRRGNPILKEASTPGQKTPHHITFADELDDDVEVVYEFSLPQRSASARLAQSWKVLQTTITCSRTESNMGKRKSYD
ncbi:unnamed protein product [Effrenium voratum]|uniref:Uncharacterized protein n=1 Tax=Effrenium voratum TaxID=2562239 RepID=A0AA36N4K2_9DINO|nr:unnamed protein product [Effrenium voratum]CAJ1394117.1 unnamed protein product [Effrenium voratum]|mmetsp:Transcript_91442/g.217899  ORF Transcript_91442/g.217899 Transcript_91442/m.217899 type:complete len:155 (-) Transcript_91442:77-541(-)